VADALKEEAIVVALRAMALAKPNDTLKVEQLSRRNLWQTYKVDVDGRPLLVRSSNDGGCAAAHFYATTAARYVPDFRPQVLGYDAERDVLVEEWLDPREYKSLAQELLHEPTSHGWSTPFRADEFSEIDFKDLLDGVGETIGKIHTGTKGLVHFKDDAKAPITQAGLPETYLRAASAHPHLANRLRGITEKSASVEPVLLHGCLSPALVLFSQEQVAITSSHHVASGDPALDLAHMMAHLFVASIHRGTSIFVEIAGYFHFGYARAIETLDKLSIMYRAGPLSVAFMLALLQDEQTSSFLSPRDKEDILDFSQWWLGRRDYTLGEVRYALWDAVEGAIDWRKKFESLPRAND
jgi:hypothetical protein